MILEIWLWVVTFRQCLNIASKCSCFTKIVCQVCSGYLELLLFLWNKKLILEVDWRRPFRQLLFSSLLPHNCTTFWWTPSSRIHSNIIFYMWPYPLRKSSGKMQCSTDREAICPVKTDVIQGGECRINLETHSVKHTGTGLEKTRRMKKLIIV